MLTVFFAGCATLRQAAAPVPAAQGESSREAEEALTSVVGAVSGRDVNAEDLKNLAYEVRRDPEAHAAVESISNAVQGNVVIKYCPVDGKRFSARVDLCPEHNVALNILEE
ncbi:MAG: hypothetical protein Q8Q08_01535 [Candidatus Omnitrophota bacterium]|nr:hypothetical protein [Candidatus Omnitrophota bacterium]